MAKFNPILMQKVEKEQQEEKEQKRLREESGIMEENIHLKEKGIKDYGKQVLKGIAYAVFVVLIFVGIVAVLNPESQAIMHSLLKAFLPI